MSVIRFMARGSCLISLAILLASCVIAPYHEGYYDRAHHRYYHNHAWHGCHEHDPYCH